MKLTFLGAAREVTGSRFLLEACGKKIMVDYGMEQGVDLYENAPLPISAAAIDSVLLTHAHIDHSGYLPLLVKQGFSGPIYTTRATADLCRIMLLDSAHIQESEAEYKNRKALRAGKPTVEPLYTQEDAMAACEKIRPCAYGEKVDLFDGVSIRMTDVGHLLGSASIQVTVTEDGVTKTIAFSGDIGNVNQPFLRDPEYLRTADYVVMESTYGDRSHGPKPDYISSLTRILQETFDRGGNVVIPSFAVGRTQEMLYFIREIKQRGLVRGHDHFPVYVDSPLGIEATHIFNENTMECADEETLAVIRSGVNPLTFDDLIIAASSDESKLINTDETPKVIISASGMCDAGRIRHHLKHNLWRSESTVLFVGYQSVGTLGRILVDGAEKVKLFGEEITVAAKIETLAGISGHADNTGLIRWASAFSPLPEHFFVVHGDEGSAETLTHRLRDELGADASAPYNGESWNLSPLMLLAEGNHEKIRKASFRQEAAEETPAPAHENTVRSLGKKKQGKTASNSAYAQLQQAGEKIGRLIEKMRSRSAKEQTNLSKQLNGILKKYGFK